MRGIGVIFAGLSLVGWEASAQQLSLDVEALRVEAVGDAWVSVGFLNSYTSAVVACAYNLPSAANPPAIPRIRNVSSTGMELRAQRWAPSGTVAASAIHCLVVDEGVHTLAGGQVLEARRVVSTNTVGWANNWPVANYENVTSTFTQSFPNLVVIGSVMTANDPEPSSFTTRASGNRNTRPTSANFLVGKHIGQISGTRATETLGVIATSPGSGTANDVQYLFGVGPNGGAGVGNSPPYSTPVTGDFDTGVITQNAENGGQGGFAVLYGPIPLPNAAYEWAIDEETFAGDTGRSHIAEEVAHALFANNQTTDLTGTKGIDAGTAPHFVPGTEVDYTLSVSNAGSAPARELFFTDPISTDLEVFTADLAGPGSGPVELLSTNSGLSLGTGDVGFSSSVSPPASFAACTYSPSGTYDAAIRHICLRPTGVLKAGSLEATTPQAVFRFRTRLR